MLSGVGVVLRMIGGVLVMNRLVSGVFMVFRDLSSVLVSLRNFGVKFAKSVLMGVRLVRSVVMVSCVMSRHINDGIVGVSERYRCLVNDWTSCVWVMKRAIMVRSGVDVSCGFGNCFFSLLLLLFVLRLILFLLLLGAVG